MQSDDATIDRELIAGRKISAIEAYRQTTGASLVDAKRVVEAREAALRQAGRMPAIPARLFRLNLWVLSGFAVFVIIVLALVMMLFYKAGSAFQ